MNSNALLIMTIPAGVAVCGGALAAVWKPIATLVLFGGLLTFWAIQLMGR